MHSGAEEAVGASEDRARCSEAAFDHFKAVFRAQDESGSGENSRERAGRRDHSDAQTPIINWIPGARIDDMAIAAAVDGEVP